MSLLEEVDKASNLEPLFSTAGSRVSNVEVYFSRSSADKGESLTLVEVPDESIAM